MEKYTEFSGQRSFFSPRERPKLSEIGPASFLHLCVAPWSDPPCEGLGPRILSAIPEVCCPAWPWNPNDDIHLTLYPFDWIIMGLLTAQLLSLPASDVFCWWSSSSSDSAPCSRSLLPFSMLLLELPGEVWVTPNLHVEERRLLGISNYRSQLEPHKPLSPTLFGI